MVNLNNAPYLDQKAHELRETIRNMLLEAAAVNPQGAANKPEEVRQNKTKLIQRFGAWSKDYNEWLKTAGKTYGGLIELHQSPGSNFFRIAGLVADA